MFIGLQDDLIVSVADTREELEQMPCIEFTDIREVEFAKMYNGVIYTNPDSLLTAQETEIRRIRDEYLVTYVDAIVSNPLRWADRSDGQQEQIKAYRRYLLDFECTSETAPKSFDEWIS